MKDDLRAIALLDQLNEIDARLGDHVPTRGSQRRAQAGLIISAIVLWGIVGDYLWMLVAYVAIALSSEHLLRSRMRRRLEKQRARLLEQHDAIIARVRDDT